MESIVPGALDDPRGMTMVEMSVRLEAFMTRMEQLQNNTDHVRQLQNAAETTKNLQGRVDQSSTDVRYLRDRVSDAESDREINREIERSTSFSRRITRAKSDLSGSSGRSLVAHLS